jgi:hypothetical protein
MTRRSIFRYFKTSPEIIRLAVRRHCQRKIRLPDEPVALPFPA